MLVYEPIANDPVNTRSAEANSLSVMIQTLGDVSVLRCTGRITLGDTDILRKAVRNQSLVPTIVLDLAEVSAIDAAGLGALVDLHGWAVANGKEFKLMNLTPTVEEVLQVTKLTATFEVCSFREMMGLLCLAINRTGTEHAPSRSHF